MFWTSSKNLPLKKGGSKFMIGNKLFQINNLILFFVCDIPSAGDIHSDDQEIPLLVKT